MTSPYLLSFFNAVYLLALTSWVGSVAFFSFGVAPIIFKVLGPESAAKFVRALFPRYYTWGATSAAIALPAVVCGPLTYPELRGPAILVQAAFVAIGALIMLYCGNALTPAINAARDAGPEQDGRFKSLHKRSVVLNGVALLIGAGLLVSFAIRQVPRSGGIVEPKPGELNDGLRKFLRDSAEIEAKQKAILEGKLPPPEGMDPKILPKRPNSVAP
jgi:hypothetical protein